MFTNVHDFVSTGVSALVANKPRLHVLFATYNCVEGYESGAVATGKDGLTIQVQNGNLEYSPRTLSMAIGGSLNFGTAFGDVLTRGLRVAMDDEAQTVQSQLVSSLDVGKATDETPLLAVVYAGLSAFEDAVDMARDIKRQHPSAAIVITTCDCTIDDKKWKLEPLLRTGEIQAVVVTGSCGGRPMMREILEAVIENFSVPQTTVVGQPILPERL